MRLVFGWGSRPTSSLAQLLLNTWHVLHTERLANQELLTISHDQIVGVSHHQQYTMVSLTRELYQFEVHKVSIATVDCHSKTRHCLMVIVIVFKYGT